MSSSSAPPRKLRHIKGLWLEDGNIILVAAGAKYGFRLYRGLLASQSSIFSDMFAAATPSTEESLNGCSVVHLSDCMADLVYFLRVLLPGQHQRYASLLHASLWPPNASPVFQLLRQQQCHHVRGVRRGRPPRTQARCRKRALDLLREHFTSDFDVWEDDEHREPLTGVDEDRTCAIGAVNLARLTNTPSILPLALYLCARLGGDVLKGWTHNGTTEHLPQEDLERCINARARLTSENTAGVSRALSFGGWLCAGMCQAVLRHVHTQVLAEQVEDRKWTCDALGARDRDRGRAVEDALAPAGRHLCGRCQWKVRTWHEVYRRHVWRTLPEIFEVEVEGWGVEEDMEVDDEDEAVGAGSASEDEEEMDGDETEESSSSSSSSDNMI
ncbi:uncharacterized protein BXZ73DRAFT_81038 [Epithele typhae]|uniref:uncharacterized protein n=1 Tax=Epithele typhae TaxID=378194 RepID=UPI002008BDB8|nr:uncharacterized protein BXZ73DRAFT_81038 [Epithele typhae]KAH9916590.1 hypothetical protein BXZ73DRAFT_81038 [Epithele typhae]